MHNYYTLKRFGLHAQIGLKVFVVPDRPIPHTIVMIIISYIIPSYPRVGSLELTIIIVRVSMVSVNLFTTHFGWMHI